MGKKAQFYNTFHRNLRQVIPNGATEVLRRYHEYLKTVNFFNKAHIRNQEHLSDRVFQGGELWDHIGFKNACNELRFHFDNMLRSPGVLGDSFKWRYDRVFSAKVAFLAAFSKANDDMRANSTNLVLVMEVMVSQIMDFLGQNTTSVAMGSLVMIQSGNGHYRRHIGMGQVVAVNEKLNSVGLDFVILIVNRIWNTLLIRAEISDPSKNMQAPWQLSTWTGKGLEIGRSVSVVDNKIESMPPSSLTHSSNAVTEARGAPKQALIHDTASRNEEYNKRNANSADQDNNNIRKAMCRYTPPWPARVFGRIPLTHVCFRQESHHAGQCLRLW